MGKLEDVKGTPSQLNYESPSAESSHLGRLETTAAFNVAAAIASLLIVVFGSGPSRFTMFVWTVSCLLFGISYLFLLLQVVALSQRGGVKIQRWILWWTLVVGAIAAAVVIGFICFMTRW